MTLKHSVDRRKVLTALGGVAVAPLASPARAQASPAKTSFASSRARTPSHFLGRMFNEAAGFVAS